MTQYCVLPLFLELCHPSKIYIVVRPDIGLIKPHQSRPMRIFEYFSKIKQDAAVRLQLYYMTGLKPKPHPMPKAYKLGFF